MMRPLLRWKTRSMTGAISFSAVVKPGTSALVESTMKRSTPSSPSRANARRSVIRPSSGSWSILKSPVCSTMPAPVRIATASASGIEWLTATNSRSKGPKLIRSPSATTCCAVSLSRCSCSLERSSARVSLEPTSGMSRALAQEVRRRADVVLVAVGEHQRLDVVEAVPDRGRSRAGSGRRRGGSPRGRARRSRRSAAVRRTRRRSCCGRPRRARRAGSPAARLGRGRRSGELGMWVGQRRRLPSVSPVAYAGSTQELVVLGTSGSRTARLSSTPSSCMAALAVIAPWARAMIASTSGSSSRVDLERPVRSPASTAATMSAYCSPATWPTTETTPTAPWVSQPRLSTSSPE